MSNERLAEIKAREQAATSGPWDHDRVDFDSGMTMYEIWGGARSRQWLAHVEDAKPNADFIAHARQDIPELIAEVERLRERSDFWQASFEEADEIASELKAEAEALRGGPEADIEHICHGEPPF